ncbi:EutN/CcmL family microcompartment protein [Propionibacteriaceae bacterium Y1923]|uniref:EutN/CcmL family microcompartment protein n=1 Tax=Aestuariimicrobium sp. Y1814 TaxID=3418742 RepID=UPI003C1A93AD
MKTARVIGSVVSTMKVEDLRGSKLLVLRAVAPDDTFTGDPFVAVDAIGAGHGEVVLVAEGSAARHTDRTASSPVDALIIGIIDSIEVDGQTTFRKN